MKRIGKRHSRFTTAIMAAILASLSFWGPVAQAEKPKESSIETQLEALLAAEKKEEQASMFQDMVTARFKYVTSRSLCGKSGKWIAFVDLYEQYEEGKPSGKYILQRATVQYGLDTLPATAKSSILTIGEENCTVKVDKDAALFNFPTTPIIELDSKAKSNSAKISIDAGKQSADFALAQDYPHKSFESIEDVLTAMTPAYLTYANKKDGAFDHAFLRLRSYVEDSDSVTRIYSWELTLVQKDTLPSKAIVIRYDCDTQKVAAAVSREIRSYF